MRLILDTYAHKPQLFNHDPDGSYDDLSGVHGIDCYVGRALGGTLPGDVMQLPERLRAQLPFILAHYHRVQLPCATDFVWDLSHGVAHDYPDLPVSVFLFGDDAHRARPDKGRLRATRQLNDKNQFIKLCQELGIPTPITELYNRGQIPKHSKLGLPLRVKEAVSASGLGVVRCDRWRKVRRTARKINGNYQLQAEVKNALAWLNVQYQILPDGSVAHVATTDQILKGSSHDGNSFPSRYDPRHLTDRLAARAAKMGARGVIAFDVVVFGVPDTPQYALIECNPRPNGSSYFTAVAFKVGARQWSGRNVETSFRSLADIVFGNGSPDPDEYSPERGTGYIIVNWGPVLLGKLGVLFIGTPKEQDALHQRFWHRVNPGRSLAPVA